MPPSDAVDFDLSPYTPPVGSAVDFELQDLLTLFRMLGIGIAGKIGKPNVADPLGVNGIYQMRMTKRGKVPVRMRFYRPTNPQTVPQEANRSKFAAAVSAWMGLTPEEKESYTIRAKKRSMFGWGLFIREYYKNNP